MKIIDGFEYNPGLSLALGFFDGVHLAHQIVITNAVYFAKSMGEKSAVVTFSEHPVVSIFGKTPQYIMTLKNRLEKIAELGVDYAYVIDFDKELQGVKPSEYLENYLVKYFSPKSITTGFNHSFGVNKTGNPYFLSQNQKTYSYKYFEIPPITHNNLVISSTQIREFILNADIENANLMLGKRFFIESKVVTGQKKGRTIGFPTANIIYPEQLIKIPQGVYCAKVEYAKNLYDAVLNFGLKPTLTDAVEPVLEVHILDFNKDIYGQKIKIYPLRYLRAEKKFSSIEELKNSITKDIKESKRVCEKF